MKTPPLMCARSATLLLLTLLITIHVLAAAPARAASRNRLSFPRKFWNFEAGSDIAMETTIKPLTGVKDVERRERHLVWRDLVHKDPPLSNSHTPLGQILIPERRKRGRRQALFSSRGHVHGQLMRVGCVLGTCQVQNLSYRLYLLIGRRKKEHSSPVNPRSPHSYG